MKTFIALMFTVCAFASAGYSQSVGITAKKVTYTRINPSADHRKAFEITYPKIKAITPAISRKIEAILSYEKVFDFKLSEELSDSQWLYQATYSVDYNANKILGVSLMIEGSGAYPQAITRYFVIDTSTGTRLVPATAFINRARLLAKVKKLKEAEVNDVFEETKIDSDYNKEDLTRLFTDADKYNKITLDDMSIDENGIVFHYNYGFPHVVQALQPAGEFFLTWRDLKPYIKKGNLLAQFHR